MKTFIVRVWKPAAPLGGDAPRTELHGSVQQIPSGRVTHFRSSTDLLETLLAAVEVEDGHSPDEAFKSI